MRKENNVKKGQPLTLTSGEWDCYSIDLVCKTLRDFNVGEQLKKWKDRGGEVTFYSWLIDKGFVETIPCSELFIYDERVGYDFKNRID